MPKPKFSPRAKVPLMAGVAAFLLGSAMAWYLAGLASSQALDEVQKLSQQIVRSMALQLSRTLSAGDDLAALAQLKDARANYPQLTAAMLVDRQGQILLQSDPVSQPAAAASGRTSHGKPAPHIFLAALPGNEELYLRAHFDRQLALQNMQAYAIRFGLATALLSIGIGCVVWLSMSRFEWIDQKAMAPEKNTPASDGQWLELLISEIQPGAMALSRDNRILAVNPLALSLLGCRREETVGAHFLRAPLPQNLAEFYLQASGGSGQPCHGTVQLKSGEPALPIRITFAPASSQWELAWVVLG